MPLTTSVRSAVWLPLFDELADPLCIARLAARAEAAGWHGFFVWDHLSWRQPITSVADPWITLAAIAAATTSLRIGPMVTPLARRRPAKLARETATLDRLSAGRLILGAGLGSDRFGGEFSKTGDETDDRTRAAMLDEALGILTAAWTGHPVRHRGRHYVVDDITFLPRPTQPTIPIWVAGFPDKPRPLLRAAGYQGYFAVNLRSPEDIAQAAAAIAAHRGAASEPSGYDIVAPRPPGTDFTAYQDAGATWWLTDFDPTTITVADVRGVIDDGPLR